MHVVIVGGGVIGLATAWRSLVAGLTVTVLDPEPAGKATAVAAGMLPAGNENLYDQELLLRLCIASRDRYPSFVAELEETAGLPAGYRRDGVLEVAYGEADLAVLNGLRRWQENLGFAVEALDAEECRRQEPQLAERVSGGLLNPDDGSVDPRTLSAALIAAIGRLGGTVRAERVTDLLVEGDRAAGVRLADGGEVRGDRVVLAAGVWTHRLGGLPTGIVPEIKPQKGQTVRLRAERPFLARTTRGLVNGRSVFAAPRLDGEVIVGATHESRGYDTTVTAGGIGELLDITRELLPGIGELEFVGAGAASRPGSPDGLPVLGHTALEGLLLASGHGRIGIQLAPVTGDVMTHALISGELPEVAKPFSAQRF
ncbi:glycine oxidase ThiO [Kitasatospora sp. Ki12]